MLFELLIKRDGGELIFLVSRQIFEEVIFFDEGSIFLIVLCNHGRHCVSERFSIDEPEEGRLQCLDRGRPRSRVQESEFSEPFAWLKVALDDSVDFYC